MRAALRMQATLGHFVGTSGLSGSAGIRMRIGINTGEVLVGTLAGTEYTAMGDVVNTASRLQSAAPPGGILVGHTTYVLASQTIRFEPAGELDAPGREQTREGLARRRGNRATGQPISAGPQRAADRPSTRARDRPTPRSTWSASRIAVCCSPSRARTVSARSRLADELIDYLHNSVDAAVLEGACVPYGEANVWFPIANALCRYLDLDPTLPVAEICEVARQRALQLLTPVDDAEVERMVDVFVHLLGHASQHRQGRRASGQSIDPPRRVAW